jgi:hypothetical protein
MAAGTSRAEAAFRELLAAAHDDGPLTRRQTQAATSTRGAKPRDFSFSVACKPQPALVQQLLVLGDGASTAGARRSVLTALRAWLEQRRQQRQQQEEEEKEDGARHEVCT